MSGFARSFVLRLSSDEDRTQPVTNPPREGRHERVYGLVMATQHGMARGEMGHRAGSRTVTLKDVRRAVTDRRWLEVYENLSRIDQAEALAAADLELLAVAAFLRGSREGCRQARLRAYQIHVGTGDYRRAARVAIRIGLEALDTADIAEASGCLPASLSSCSAWASQASTLLEREDECAEHGWLLIPAAYEQLVMAGNAEEAARGAEQATDIGRRFGDRELQALAEIIHGRALVRLGGDDTGIGLVDEAVSLVVAGDVSPPIAGMVLTSAVDIAEESFDVQRWEEWVKVLAEWCDQQHGMVPFKARSFAYRAQLSRFHGTWTEAVEWSERAVEHPISEVDQPAAAAALYEQGEIMRLRGEFAKAEAAFHQVARRGGDPQPGLALLRLAQGDADNAFASIVRALLESEDRQAQARMLSAQVEILLTVDDLTAASNAGSELAGIADVHPSPMLEAIARQTEGKLALAENQPVAALASLRRACRVWRHFDLPYEEARARLLMARACRMLGDDDTASLELEVAGLIFTRLGAEPDAQIVEDGDARESRHGLTRRELEVLRLLAAGMTNRAIADQLVVSPRTVDTHVTNMFTKLGISNRSSATAYAHRHDLV